MLTGFLFPLLVSVVYLILAVVVVSNRPVSRHHKFLLAYLAAAFLHSFGIFVLRNPGIDVDSLFVFRLVLLLSMLWVIQLYAFTRVFLGLSNRIVILGYVGLAFFAVLCFTGQVPSGLTVESGKVIPEYNWWFAYYAAFIALAAVIGSITLVRNRSAVNPPEKNSRLNYLMAAGLILIVTGFVGIMPYAAEFPISQLGGLVSAGILAYAILRHDLITVGTNSKKVLAWMLLAMAGLVVFEILMLIGHFALGFEITPLTIAIPTIAAMVVWVLGYFTRPLIVKTNEQVFYVEKFGHRRELIEFVSDHINNVTGEEELCERFLSHMVRTFECNYAGILMQDNSSTDFIVKYNRTAKNSNLNLDLAFKIGADSIILHQFQHHFVTRRDIEILFVSKTLSEEERNAVNLSAIEVLFPLNSNGKLIGILALSRKKSGRYSLDDLSLCESVTGPFALKLETEQHKGEIEQKENRLNIINKLSAVIKSTLDIQSVYQNFISGLHDSVEINYANIGVIDNSTFRFIAEYTEGDRIFKNGEKLPIKSSGLDMLVTNKSTFIYPEQKNGKPNNYIRHLQHTGLKKFIFLPLIFNDEVVGIFTLGKKSGAPYQKYQIELLEMLAERMSSSIANYRYYSNEENKAYIDETTGLFNRRHFEDILSQEIHNHFRYGNVLSLVLMEINRNPGSGNDSSVQDNVLRMVSATVQNSVRDIDKIFRYGWDEFALLLPSTSAQNAEKVAERVRKKIEANSTKAGMAVNISMGVSGWPNNGITPEDLVISAQTALLGAKQTGGNKTCNAAEVTISENNLPNDSRLHSENKETLNAIYALAATIEAKDRYTYGHSKKVRTYAVALAEAFNLPPETVNIISHAALLHDIGKISIYDTILNKPDVLDREEREIIKTHPVISKSIVGHIPRLIPCLPAILHHHERWDGKGYPHGLKGEEIPIEARILTIADSFDAMTTERPYRKALSPEKVILELNGCSGTQFDPELMTVFMPIALKELKTMQLTKQALNNTLVNQINDSLN